MTWDKKMFGIKDVIQILIVAGTLSAMYYSIDKRLTLVEADNVAIKQTVESNGKTLETIYLGLIAKGVIDPPGQ